MASISLLTRLDDVHRVGVGQGPDAHEDGRLAGKAHFRVVIFGAQHHVADVFEADDGAVLLPDHQAFELLHRTQIGVGRQVDLDQGALGASHGGQEVVGGQGLAHLDRADVEGGHAFGFQPDAHGKGAGAEDVGPLDALKGRQPRLHDAHEVIGDLVLLERVSEVKLR
jgi:hypothetical protein